MIRPLTQALISDHIEAILDIASDVPGEHWTAANFTADLRAKWRLSIAAWAGPVPIGYAIVSEKAPDHAHLHHFMIHRDHRNDGLGARLLAQMEQVARERGYRAFTLKAHEGNVNALRFYRRHGYGERGRQGDYVMLRRGL